MDYNSLITRSIYHGTVIDWSFLAEHGLERGFLESINSDPFSRTQWANLFRINEPVYRELVREFFASIELEVIACRNNPEHVGIHFRLGGEPRSLSLLEFGWRIGLYSESQGGENCIRIALRDVVTVKVEYLIIGFWPTIGDEVFAAHLILGIFSREMLEVLSVEPRAHSFKKKSLIAMEVVMELTRGGCHWPMTRLVQLIEDDDEDEEAAEGEAGGSSDAYRGMSRGDWQEQRADWMYDHTVRKFQHMSTRDNLEPHLQIDPFPGRETNYPPFGYARPMPPGYDYHYGTAPGGSS
ncbi:hypothetical protein Tco_0527055 [Tanacetum coccineum]